MPAPLVLIGAGAIARAVATALAKEAAKQGVKKLAAREAQQVVRQVAAKQGIRRVSNVEARRIAERAAGPKAKTPTGRVPSKVMGSKTGPVVRITDKKTVVSTPMKRAGKTKTKSPVTKSYQTNRVSPSDRRAALQRERNQRVSGLLTPIKPRGTRSGGKAMIGPKPNTRVVSVAKPGRATDANKLINAPRGRMGDPARGDVPKQLESRRVALRNAGSDSRNASQPSNKSAIQRELEQRRDSGQLGAPKAKDPMQREADKRVSEGLKKANQGKNARPDMPKSKARAPKYPKSTTERFRRQTGGE